MSKNLLQRLMKAGNAADQSLLSEALFLTDADLIPTKLPVLNMAFSGDLDGGVSSGVTVLAGQSKSFKTLLALYCLKAYFDKYPDAYCIFYDSEYGTNEGYFTRYGINPKRIIHVAIEHVEQLKFDISKKLKEIERGDKVFILIDSLGGLPSLKEVEDAENEKSVADMTRAKAIRSFLRITTPRVSKKNIPCMIINHVYQTMEMYSKTVIPGGTAVTFSANQIFVITKAQEKNEKTKEIEGRNFTITIHKSRLVKENAKFPFLVRYKGGIDRYSALYDLAVECGYITKAGSWCSIIDLATGEFQPTKLYAKDIATDWYEELMTNENFKQFIKNKFQLGADDINLLDDFSGDSVEDDDFCVDEELTSEAKLRDLDDGKAVRFLKSITE